MALDSGRLLLLRFPRGARRLLRRSVHLLVRGAHPLPVVRRLRRIHEVQRACRGFPSLPLQTAENSKLNMGGCRTGLVIPSVVRFIRAWRSRSGVTRKKELDRGREREREGSLKADGMKVVGKAN